MRRFSINWGWPEKSSISLGRIVFSNSFSAGVKLTDSMTGLAIMAPPSFYFINSMIFLFIVYTAIFLYRTWKD